MEAINQKSNHISIGGLAAACGIPVETLRNWEIRYGFPEPRRLDSGHRRYSLDLIPKLREIKTLVEMGYKPSFAVKASSEELCQLMAASHNNEESPIAIPSSLIFRWMGLVRNMDVHELNREFAQHWNINGARNFIFKMAIPFLREVGNLWEKGEISVAHEHFSSEVLQTFLSGQWRPLLTENSSKHVVLANQEGELHSLGLHMAAILTTLNNVEPIFLGPNTPLNDIISAATQRKANAVVIGLSSVSDTKHSTAFLNNLQKGLIGVRLAFGGNKTIPEMSNIEYIDTLEAYDRWLTTL
ncbi:MAG: MerR family transcriptional regulator [Deltaproteobacteria bacterium]|nr:MerR family transcriptional regulator [Deltaproteobacteria bacterium]